MTYRTRGIALVNQLQCRLTGEPTDAETYGAALQTAVERYLPDELVDIDDWEQHGASLQEHGYGVDEIPEIARTVYGQAAENRAEARGVFEVQAGLYDWAYRKMNDGETPEKESIDLIRMVAAAQIPVRDEDVAAAIQRYRCDEVDGLVDR